MTGKAVAPLLLFAALVGCTTAQQAERGGPYPENYHELARAHLQQVLFDPYSVRDASISRPKPGGSALYPGWVTCLRANAKNRFGAYTGQQETAIIIQNGRVVDSQSEHAALFCSGHVYEPFPEMDSTPSTVR